MADRVRLDPETLLSAYAQGIFPMTDRDGRTRWYTADPRGVLPLEAFHVPGTLRQLLRRQPPAFDVRFDSDFEGTMRACMGARDSSWISEEIIAAYVQLHELGFAHSVECWQKRGAGEEEGGAGTRGRGDAGKEELVGGLYGVSLGAAFFGESMFHRVTDASKVALVHLVERLRERGYELLDSQATTQHLRRFGCIDIPAEEYLRRLRAALKKQCRFV